MDTFDKLSRLLENALDDLSILAGDELGPSDTAGWQDVAGTAAVNLKALASALESLRKGETHHQGVPWDGPVVFPSPKETLFDSDVD